MSSQHEILCTLGPSSMKEGIICRLDELGVSLFRINLSHTLIEDLENKIRFIQKITRVPICLDSEGAQVRTGNFIKKGFSLKEGMLLTIHRKPVAEDKFNFYPPNIFDQLLPGDLISIDFKAVLVQVIQKNDETMRLRVLNGGSIGKNKAVTVDRPLAMPPLTEKDKGAFKIGLKFGVHHFALSFANRGSDVDEVRKIVGGRAQIISKIECNTALKNLIEIIQNSDAILIDRGDLSREQPIERIPYLQKQIITTAKCLSKKVYVATNLLESMVTESEPTRAEINDVYNTLNDGANGLVLAAETAIGKYPINCVAMIRKVIHVFEQKKQEFGGIFAKSVASLLIPPHGGALVRRLASKEDLAGIQQLKKIRVAEETHLDCEQIAVGSYSPLEGFMTREDLKSVLDTNRLPDGSIWTLPIVLQVADAKEMIQGQQIALTDGEGEIRSLLDVEDIYPFDFHAIANKWFGTTSLTHPGVRKLKEGGDIFVGGKILLVKKRYSEFTPYELTPSQTRFLFEKKGWQKIVGFHSRDIIHRFHEYLQLAALEQTHADGLFISPITGSKEDKNSPPSLILKTYQWMIDRSLYPKGKVVLGSLPTCRRYAGFREVVFTALCQKNMGCSHFIIMRNDTASDPCDMELNQAFDQIGDIGITPIFFDPIGYDQKRNTYAPLHRIDQPQTITNTQMLERLNQGQQLPDWFIRNEIQELIFKEMKTAL